MLKQDLPSEGYRRLPRGSSVMHSDENWKQFSSYGSANDHLEPVGTVQYAPHLKIHSKLRFSKAHTFSWISFFSFCKSG